MDKILDGKKVSEKIITEIKKDLKQLKTIPRLEIIIIGEEYASQKYVNMKKKLANDLNIICNINQYNINIKEEKIIEEITKRNKDNNIHGIMVQLPLPQNLNTNNIVNSIEPSKDIDGLTSVNLGKIFTNDPKAFIPATPLGIMEIFKEYEIELESKNIVIIGRSLIVGIPLLSELLKQNASVTILHSKSKNIQEKTSKADILISAIGKPLYITPNFVKKDAIVIDVGISQHPTTGKICGDVDFENVFSKVKQITPVPGGVGATTVPSLMYNIVKSLKNDKQ